MGIFKKKETTSIDYSRNPMMLELLESVKQQQINRFAICLDALCTNFRLSPKGVEASGGNVLFYADRGYRMLTKDEAKALSKQMVSAVSELENVADVKLLKWVGSYPRKFRDPAARDYRAMYYQIEYRDPNAGLQDW